MFSTVVFAAIFTGALIASAVAWALFLRLGLHWAKVPCVTIRRLIAATLLVIALQVGLFILFLLGASFFDPRPMLLTMLELAAGVIVPCAVIAAIFKTRFLRALQAWLPTLLASAATYAFVLLVIRPLLYESYFIPTNAMAPTIVGNHLRGTCPECGATNYGSSRFAEYAPPPFMICDRFHVTQPSVVEKDIHAGDRIIVAKFLSPRRWDLIVFNYPEEPTSIYLKRLVALPGETVHIQAGALWIDGQRQTLPQSLQGLEYAAEIPNWHGHELWGSVDRPALLGSDEYFVLGDFSVQSMDSRAWQRSAPGHNPFAVPESYLKGVVTHTFWPPNRWRTHR